MDWLVRFLHVAGAAAWVGGYAMLVFAFLPKLEAGQERLQAGIMRAIRTISFAGTWTVLTGLALISYTRGWASFGKGEWGGMVAGSLILAIALMGISDGALRPAVRKLSPNNPQSLQKAKRWAVVSLVLGILLIAIMTRMPYAGGITAPAPETSVTETIGETPVSETPSANP